MGRIQHSISMGKDVWKFVYNNYPKLGYKTHSFMIEACVLYAIRNKFHEEISEEQLEHLKAYEEVGTQAEAVKPLLFMGNASKVLKKAEQDYEENIKFGLMTEEDRDKSLKKLRRRLRKSIQTTLKDQERLETGERAKRKKAFLKKYGYKVTKGGKIKRKA